MSNLTKCITLCLLIGLGALAGCVPLPQETIVAESATFLDVTAVAPTETAAPTEVPPTATLAPTETLAPTDVSPTATPAPTETSAPAVAVAAVNTATPRPTASPTSTRRPTATVRPTATQDRSRIIITEADITKAVTGGAAGQQGLITDNLQVNFADGKIYITADQLSYGIIRVANLNLVGRLTARNGVLSLEVESLSPRGLATNFIPTVANQALAQYASQWYVEEVRTLDGRVELRVR